MRAVDLGVSDEELHVVVHAAGLALVLQPRLQRHGAGRARRHAQPERERANAQLLHQALLPQHIETDQLWKILATAILGSP